MGSDTSSSTKTNTDVTDTTNVNNKNIYNEAHENTYNQKVDDSNTNIGDNIIGDTRNMSGMQNNGVQHFGGGGGQSLMNLGTQNQGINLQNLQPIERQILQKLQAERA